MMPVHCKRCAFYREIPPASTRGRRRKLCMLTGEPKPTAGMMGCHYIAGKWNDIDRILGLTNGMDTGNTELPNQVKPAAAFSHKGKNVANINALDDFSEIPNSHIAKAKRQFVRPGYREDPVAHLARERTGCLFRV